MNDLAIDPSETRVRIPARPVGRLVLFGVLGLAGTAAFAGAASTVLSGFAGPQRASVAIRQKASDWPDLKDGLPALSTAGLPAATVPAIALTDPSKAPATGPVAVRAVVPEPAAAAFVAPVVRIPEEPKVAPDAPSAPVIEPARRAVLAPPARPMAAPLPAVVPPPAEAVRAPTDAGTFAALPEESAKPVTTKPVTTKPVAAKPVAVKPPVAAKPEPARVKARTDAAATLVDPKSSNHKPSEPRPSESKPSNLKPAAVEKPVAEKPAARKPASVVATAAPVETAAPDEDTEVFGIKVPSFAPAGRKIRESVEALGEAVKGLPDRF